MCIINIIYLRFSYHICFWGLQYALLHYSITIVLVLVLVLVFVLVLVLAL